MQISQASKKMAHMSLFMQRYRITVSSFSSFISYHSQQQSSWKTTTCRPSSSSSSSSSSSTTTTTTTTTTSNTIKFESGVIGHLAASNTLCTSKGTVVHAVVSIGDKLSNNGNNSSSNSGGNIPLNVDYKLKAYAYGMIPDTRNRRESNTIEEMLAARVVDRSLRPLFSSTTSSSSNEMQITCTVHSLDSESDPIATAVNAASCALMQTKLDWQGPVGCVRVSRVNGVLKVDLNAEERLLSDLDLLYTGTESRVLMYVMFVISFSNESFT